LRQLIEQQIERVSPEEREVLEAASVAGADFSAAAVAAGVERLPETVEVQCEALVRREYFLRASGTAEWPDGTVGARYQFLHALYQEVVYERIPAARRSRLHRRIGERLEAAYGAQAREIAAELAVHFERGRDDRRAIQYLHQAGENASQRNAYVEAISLLTKGLELLKLLPDTPECARQELALQTALGLVLMAVKGYAALEVEKAYSRARELCRQFGDTPQLFPVLFGLAAFHIVREKFQTARELAEAAIALCSEQGFTQHGTAGTIHRGWALAELGQGEEGIAELRQGMAAHLATGAKVFRPYNFTLLAEVYGKVGQAEEGLTVLAEPLVDLVHKTGECVAGAELYRVKGELMLQQFQVSGSKFQVAALQPRAPDPPTEAEACFLKAIEIACKQSAKSWELRASTSLTRLWQRQGKSKQAHDMLAEIYNWFTEGFDTKDLQEAKALLNELSH
jgi:predicted ATPase